MRALESKGWMLLLFLASGLPGCGSSTRDRENYGDLSVTPGGTAIVAAEEHPAGWGRRDCLVCHNAALNLHRRPGNGLNADAIAAAAQANGGSPYCLTCHGPNGL
jgi:hypothetical protein